MKLPFGANSRSGDILMARFGIRLAVLLALIMAHRVALADVHEGVERFPSGDAKVSIEYFRPAARGTFPGIFLLHGSGGLDPGTAHVFREIGRDLADQGYVVLIPHFFERTGHEPGQPFKENEVTSLFKSVGDAIDFAVANAPIDADRIGVVGYSMGANMAFFQAARDQRIKAIVGVSAWLPVESKSTFPPLLILLGSGDRNTPPARLKQFETILKERQIPYGSHVYRGIGHNFDVSTWDDAGRRATTFFDKFLKTPNAKKLTRNRTPNRANTKSAKRDDGSLQTKAASRQTEATDAPGKVGPAKPQVNEVKPKSGDPQPIFIDAQPMPAEAQPKNSPPQRKAGETQPKTASSKTERS